MPRPEAWLPIHTCFDGFETESASRVTTSSASVTIGRSAVHTAPIASGINQNGVCTKWSLPSATITPG